MLNDGITSIIPLLFAHVLICVLRMLCLTEQYVCSEGSVEFGERGLLHSADPGDSPAAGQRGQVTVPSLENAVGFRPGVSVYFLHLLLRCSARHRVCHDYTGFITSPGETQPSDSGIFGNERQTCPAYYICTPPR